MTVRFFLCDDSCEPIDPEALSICHRPESEMDNTGWTYDNIDDLIESIESIEDSLDNMKNFRDESNRSRE